MIIDFRQGIISYPTSGFQPFIQQDGLYYNLVATVDNPTIISFAYRYQNYTFDEISTVSHAWGPIPNVGQAWIYWDLNLLTALRTFGFTSLEPIVSPTAPTSPAVDQHWFDSATVCIKVWNGTQWIPRIRLFAAVINNATILPYGSNPTAPFAGTQVSIAGSNITVDTSHLLFDRNGKPIIKQDGLFVTAADEFFIQGSAINNITLESTVLRFIAATSIPKYHVVKVLTDGTITLASYNDLSTTFISMCTQSLNTGEVGSVVSQGVITNPDWNWTTPGDPLWIDSSGALSTINLNVTQPTTHSDSKPPVARIVNRTTVFFDQGLGGKGTQGIRGETGDSITVSHATNLVAGIVKLSVPSITMSNPIAVGTNDPRLTDQRATPIVLHYQMLMICFVDLSEQQLGCQTLCHLIYLLYQ